MRGRSGTIAFLHSAYLEPRRGRNASATTSTGLKCTLGASLTPALLWLLALLGLVVFYGLERAALVSRADDADDEASAGVFWIHMASYGLYNALIGYLLTHGEAKTGTKLGLFWVAMALP